MPDLYATAIGIEAELEYRRRQFSTLRRSSPLEPPPRRTFRVIIAEALAHLALHLDGSAIGSVTHRHTHHPQGGAA